VILDLSLSRRRYLALVSSVQLKAAAPRTALFPSGKPDGINFTLPLKMPSRWSSIERFVGLKSKSPA
jgi:hypothetical protein